MNVSVNKTKLNFLKKITKRGLQHLAASFGRHTKKNSEAQLLVLMYHRILPQEDSRVQLEEPGMIVSPDTFRLHLNILKEYFTIVNLSDWIQLKEEGKALPARACAITFDDGWADNYEYAFPVLKELNIPATIFLVSDMISTKKMFWPERLARLIVTISKNYPQHWNHPELAWLQNNKANYRFSKNAPSREELSVLIADAKNYSDNDIHNRISQIETALQLDSEEHQASLLNWQQISTMIDSNLIEIGSHTCHHVRLNNNASDQKLNDEIVSSKATIEQNIGKNIKTFCFPNGDFCPQALELVEKNYLAAVSTQSGWHNTSGSNHLIKRIGIHQDITNDRTSFLARISGWM